MTADQLTYGQNAKITGYSESQARSKLIEFGFVPGQVISISFRAPLGDPIAIEIGGGLVSMRREEARSLLVEPVEN